jgi:hypothetical protein
MALRRGASGRYTDAQSSGVLGVIVCYRAATDHNDGGM